MHQATHIEETSKCFACRPCTRLLHGFLCRGMWVQAAATQHHVKRTTRKQPQNKVTCLTWSVRFSYTLLKHRSMLIWLYTEYVVLLRMAQCLGFAPVYNAFRKSWLVFWMGTCEGVVFTCIAPTTFEGANHLKRLGRLQVSGNVSWIASLFWVWKFVDHTVCWCISAYVCTLRVLWAPSGKLGSAYTWDLALVI